MKISVLSISTDQTFEVEVGSDITIADLKSLINAELRTHSSFSSQEQNAEIQLSLYHNGKLLADSTKSLSDAGIRDNDLLALHAHLGANRRQQQHRQQQQHNTDTGARQGLMEPDAEMLRLQVLGNVELMEQLRMAQPELANAINDPARFRQVYGILARQRREAEEARQREIDMLDNDPFNPEAQARIAELIRQDQVRENLQNALEHNPEAFGKVIMLYIDVEVNGHKVKAFVDSGAQATIMSPDCAEKCNIMRLVDSRFAGIARGVGTAKILGRVHSAQIKIGSLYLACSFTVMEGKSVDLLLGLDMLKRHQANIDLERNCLVIQGVEVPFLGEADIPKNFEEWERENEPTVEGPGGAKIGARSGALVAGPSSSSAQAQATSPTGGGMIVRDIPASAPASAPFSGVQQRGRLHPPELPARQQVQFSEVAIEQLQGLGFSRQEAIAALQATGGDVDMAASLLFN